VYSRPAAAGAAPAASGPPLRPWQAPRLRRARSRPARTPRCSSPCWPPQHSARARPGGPGAVQRDGLHACGCAGAGARGGGRAGLLVLLLALMGGVWLLVALTLVLAEMRVLFFSGLSRGGNQSCSPGASSSTRTR